jgi:hypothetical protein
MVLFENVISGKVIFCAIRDPTIRIKNIPIRPNITRRNLLYELSLFLSIE